MIERWSRWVVCRRWWVIGSCLLLTVAAVFGMSRLYFSNRLTDWLPRDDAQIARHLDVSEKFSVNNLVLILVKPDNGVFRFDLLEKVKDFTERLKGVDGISMVTSIGNAADIRKIPDGIEVSNLLDVIPKSGQAIEALRDKVLEKDIFRNRIVSADGEWLAISAYIASHADQVKLVAEIIIPETEKVFGSEGECFFTGMPAETHFINQFVGRDLITLVPAALFLILAILFFSFRSWQGVAFPIMVVVVSTVWLFGVIGYLNSPLTIISPVLPVVIIALGSAYGIHVLNRLIHQAAESGRTKNESIASGVRVIFIPLVLAGLTDLAGFLTFKSARLTLIADFGVYTALGLLLAMVVALTLVPALATFSDLAKMDRAREGHSYSIFLARLGNFVIVRRRLLLGLGLGIMAAFACALTLLHQEVSFAKFYPDTSLPRRSMEAANAHFDGAYPLAVAVEAEQVRSPETLRVLRWVQNFIGSLPHTSQPFAVTDFIQELNWQLNDRYAIPDRTAAVGNLWFFIEGRDELSQLLTGDDREAVIFAKISDPLTSFNKDIYRRVQDFLASETRGGFFIFERQALTPSQQHELHAAQAAFLSQELDWLTQRYFPGAARRATLENIMVDAPERKLPFAEIETRCRDVLWEYVTAPEFDFLLTAAQKERFFKGLMEALAGHYDRAPASGPFMRGLLPPDIYDAVTADDLAGTIDFKLAEIDQQQRVEMIWQKMALQLKMTDPDLERKCKSVIYDLTAASAVLPPAHGESTLPAGRRLPIKRIDQTGYPLMMNKMDRFLFTSLLQSLLLAYILIVVFMMLMRRSISLGIISTLPVVFTSVVMFGFLALIGVPLDYATMMIGGVSIGVGIDYAIHFVHGFITERDAGFRVDDAIRRAFLDKGKAILTNALSVMAGFAVLLLSSLVPLRNFAWAMVCAMFLAALSALTLLPAALRVFDLKIKK